MEHQITIEDLERAFKFSKDYFLEKSNTASRTTGQYRGLGSIADDFMIGKVLEIAVASILETDEKKPILDFEIHALTEENRSDPDIVSINERGIERKPNVFIEIKVISESDRWIGLTQEQFEAILSNPMADDTPSNIFIIYATLKSRNPEKSADLLGSYLNSKNDSGMYEAFCKLDELYIEIKCVLTGQELQEYGTKFNEGSFMYETEMFNEVSNVTLKALKDYANRDKYSLYGRDLDALPIITSDPKKIPREFGDFSVKGTARYILKQNEKSQRLYVWCEENLDIQNDVVGNFTLIKDKAYDATIYTLGRSPSLKRNNIWIAQRNLDNVLEKTAEERMDELKEKI